MHDLVYMLLLERSWCHARVWYQYVGDAYALLKSIFKPLCSSARKVLIPAKLAHAWSMTLTSASRGAETATALSPKKLLSNHRSHNRTLLPFNSVVPKSPSLKICIQIQSYFHATKSFRAFHCDPISLYIFFQQTLITWLSLPKSKFILPNSHPTQIWSPQSPSG